MAIEVKEFPLESQGVMVEIAEGVTTTEGTTPVYDLEVIWSLIWLGEVVAYLATISILYLPGAFPLVIEVERDSPE